MAYDLDRVRERIQHIEKNLARLVAKRSDDPVIDPAIEQLYENQLLVEGLHPNPAAMIARIQTLMEAATGRDLEG